MGESFRPSPCPTYTSPSDRSSSKKRGRRSFHADARGRDEPTSVFQPRHRPLGRPKTHAGNLSVKNGANALPGRSEIHENFIGCRLPLRGRLRPAAPGGRRRISGCEAAGQPSPAPETVDRRPSARTGDHRTGRPSADATRGLGDTTICPCNTVPDFWQYAARRIVRKRRDSVNSCASMVHPRQKINGGNCGAWLIGRGGWPAPERGTKLVPEEFAERRQAVKITLIFGLSDVAGPVRRSARRTAPRLAPCAPHRSCWQELRAQSPQAQPVVMTFRLWSL